MKNLHTQSIVKAILKTILKTAASTAFSVALLLLSTGAHAKQKQAAPTSTQKYHIVVANLSGQPVRVGLRKQGDKGVQAHATEFLDAGQNIDRVIDRKLDFLLVRGHGMNEKVYSLNPEKGAMFLIEQTNDGNGIMVTPFVNDHEGWLQWRDAVARANAQLNQ
jgi:hypothetical protein